MYSERNRQPSRQRSDDAFLRRMIGGELTGDRSFNTDGAVFDAELLNNVKTRCNGDTVKSRASYEECGDEAWAPSLAMVYSPKQCFRNLLDPSSALEHGSLFAELVMPFEGGAKCMGTEVKTRR